MRILLGLVAMILAACGSDNGGAGGDDDSGGADAGGGGDECGEAQVFDPDLDACVDASPVAGDVEAVIYLFQQTTIAATGAFANPAKAEASFWSYEARPADPRDSFTTADGERCAYDADTNWPSYFDGVSWPAGPGLGAGDLSFTIEGAPGEVVLEASDFGGDLGTAYFHGDTPPPIVDGATTYSDFFDASYVPPGAGFTVAAAGGDDVAPVTWDGGGPIPESPTVLEPDFESGNAATVGADLTVRWATTRQRGTRIELAFSYGDGGGTFMMRCDLDDDGEVVLPADKLVAFTGIASGFYLSRQTRRTILGATSGSGRLFLQLRSRNDRMRLVNLTGV